MVEHAVYNAETNRWYREGDSLKIRVLKRGDRVNDFVDGVKASTYPEAFEKLFGHPVSLPPLVREAWRSSILSGD